MDDLDMTYDDLVKRGWASFDTQPECEDFIRWAIDEINRLKEENKQLTEENYDWSKGRQGF